MHIDKQIPHLLNGIPTHCNWCSGMLKGLRNIYKGQNCERYYCSQACLSQGEDRAIRYKATLAGRVCSPWYVGAAAILAVFMLGFTFTGASRAQPDWRPKVYCALALPPSQLAKLPRLEAVYCNGIANGQCSTTLGWLVVTQPVRCD